MEVADHIFNETWSTNGGNFYDIKKMRLHFGIARNLDPTFTEGAIRILKSYYLACRADTDRDAGRTTIRLNDGLYRLAKAHAKLLFRAEVTEIDAVLAITLIESSLGFGRILQPLNIVREKMPLGPTVEHIGILMDKLKLEENFHELSAVDSLIDIPAVVGIPAVVVDNSVGAGNNLRKRIRSDEIVTTATRHVTVTSATQPAYEVNKPKRARLNPFGQQLSGDDLDAVFSLDFLDE